MGQRPDSPGRLTALVGGLRVLNSNAGQSAHGVVTDRPETLTNDFFVNLLDIGTVWTATSESDDVFGGRDRSTGQLRWTGTRVDLIFVSAWDKVMNLDRFDTSREVPRRSGRSRSRSC
jgi:catalase-peroxidase